MFSSGQKKTEIQALTMEVPFGKIRNKRELRVF